jgi:hypothetical protein
MPKTESEMAYLMPKFKITIDLQMAQNALIGGERTECQSTFVKPFKGQNGVPHELFRIQETNEELVDQIYDYVLNIYQQFIEQAKEYQKPTNRFYWEKEYDTQKETLYFLITPLILQR